MIRVASESVSVMPEWHEVFLRLLPAIVTHAKIAFRHLDPEAKQEAVQDVVCNACSCRGAAGRIGQARSGLPERAGHTSPSARSRMAARSAATLNVNDVLSPYCQQRKNVKVESIDHFDDDENGWRQAVVVDTRSSPVPEIVAFRCDFSDWLQSLPRRDCHIAESLGRRQPHERSGPEVRCERGPDQPASPRTGRVVAGFRR